MKNRLRHSCPASEILEDHADERFAAGVRPHVEDLCVHETLGRHDLAVDALERVLLAVGPPDHEVPGSAHSEVDLTDCKSVVVTSSPPPRDVLGRCPYLEDKTTRRIEVARQNDLAIGGQGHGKLRTTCCGVDDHVSSSSVAVLAD